MYARNREAREILLPVERTGWLLLISLLTHLPAGPTQVSLEQLEMALTDL